MQGRNETLLTTTDKLYSFLLKLKLWQTNVASDVVFKMFSLIKIATRAVNQDILKSIGSCLEMLQQRFKFSFRT